MKRAKGRLNRLGFVFGDVAEDVFDGEAFPFRKIKSLVAAIVAAGAKPVAVCPRSPSHRARGAQFSRLSDECESRLAKLSEQAIRLGIDPDDPDRQAERFRDFLKSWRGADGIWPANGPFTAAIDRHHEWLRKRGWKTSWRGDGGILWHVSGIDLASPEGRKVDPRAAAYLNMWRYLDRLQLISSTHNTLGVLDLKEAFCAGVAWAEVLSYQAAASVHAPEKQTCYNTEIDRREAAFLSKRSNPKERFRCADAFAGNAVFAHIETKQAQQRIFRRWRESRGKKK